MMMMTFSNYYFTATTAVVVIFGLSATFWAHGVEANKNCRNICGYAKEESKQKSSLRSYRTKHMVSTYGRQMIQNHC
jgi:hypothetical protein